MCDFELYDVGVPLCEPSIVHAPPGDCDYFQDTVLSCHVTPQCDAVLLFVNTNQHRIHPFVDSEVAHLQLTIKDLSSSRLQPSMLLACAGQQLHTLLTCTS